MPSPRRCLDDINRELPKLAAELTTKLLNETTQAQEKLQSAPEDVAAFVEYSDFLQKTSARQKEFGERGAAVQAMYALMAEYSVPVMDAEAASMKMMETMQTQLTHLIAQVESSQEERTTQFTEDIETSIAQLRTKSTELFAESEDKSLFDGATEVSRAAAGNIVNSCCAGCAVVRTGGSDSFF